MGLRTDGDLSDSGGSAGSEVGGTQTVVLGQEKLGFYDVLAERPDVVVGRDRGPDFDGRVVQAADDFYHDHGVEFVRDRVRRCPPRRPDRVG